MNLVSLERVTRRHAEKLVLDGVTLGVDDGDRVGVIGVNGSGKSTLLRLIAGVDEPDAGRVVHANRLRVDYVPQDATLPRGQAALEAVLDGYRPPGPLEESWRAEHRARANLDRLGIRDADRRLAAMSGGERKRVALARALTRADAEAAVGETASLLVLDEPTNHLDIDVVEWLETELRQRGGGLVLVSHDRYLLDRVTTRVVEVDRGRLYPYHGSYAAYLEDRAAREEHAAAAEGKRQARARVELAWLRRNPSARTTKARARVERAQALVEADPHRPRPELRIALPARRIGSKVVNLHSVGKAYDGRWVIRGFDHKLAPGERVGVVGPNGSGKTTLLRLVAGLEQPDEGSVRHGVTVHVGFYGQDPRPLPPRTRVLDAVKDVVAETNTVDGLTLSAAQILERFLFPPLAQKAYVSELSGGERRRLELLRVLATAPNLLLLDEPTNDLDLDTLAVLEDYLDTWPGTLVAASHDRFFLDRVCGHLLSLEPDGGVRDHPGGWSAYRASRQRGPRQPVGGPATERPSRRTRKLSYNERRELGALSGRIAELERRRTELGEAVAAAGSDFIEAQARSAELADVLEELDEAESRWLELSIIEEA